MSRQLSTYERGDQGNCFANQRSVAAIEIAVAGRASQYKPAMPARHSRDGSQARQLGVAADWSMVVLEVRGLLVFRLADEVAKGECAAVLLIERSLVADRDRVDSRPENLERV